MSYMKSERASRWATCEFEHKAKSRHLRFINWVDFEEEFWKDFMPLDSEAAAVNVLETVAYFQRRQSVNDYLDQFKDLIKDSSYADLKTRVVKFRQGLDGPCRNDIRTALRHGSRSLVPPCCLNGPEPCGGRGLPHLPPTTPCPDPRHEPLPDDILTCSSCSCRTLCPLQSVPRQSCPDGHRCDSEGQSHP